MFFFNDDTMGDIGPYTWNGNPFDYIQNILGLYSSTPRATGTGGSTPNPTPQASGYGAAYDNCVRIREGDLYGDCDYLIPLYAGSPTNNNSNSGGGNKTPVSTETWEQWFEKNKIPLMMGGVVLALVLTKKR